jgi:hypothetical protein
MFNENKKVVIQMKFSSGVIFPSAALGQRLLCGQRFRKSYNERLSYTVPGTKQNA